MYHPQMIEWVQTFRFRKAGKETIGTTGINRNYGNDKFGTEIENMKKKGAAGDVSGCKEGRKERRI